MIEVILRREKLGGVLSLCYLGDFLFVNSPITRCCVTWGKFNELLSILILCQECHATCKRILGPNLIWSVSPVMQWSGYDPLDVWCHQLGSCQIARSPGEDAAWQSGEGTLHFRLRSHDHVECSDGWLKKIQKLKPGRSRDCGRPMKTNDISGLPSTRLKWDPPIW